LRATGTTDRLVVFVDMQSTIRIKAKEETREAMSSSDLPLSFPSIWPCGCVRAPEENVTKVIKVDFLINGRTLGSVMASVAPGASYVGLAT